MRRYLVASHHSDEYDPSLEDEAMGHNIAALSAFNFKLSNLNFRPEVHS